jgi:hypothetical protein
MLAFKDIIKYHPGDGLNPVLMPPSHHHHDHHGREKS